MVTVGVAEGVVVTMALAVRVAVPVFPMHSRMACPTSTQYTTWRPSRHPTSQANLGRVSGEEAHRVCMSKSRF